MKNTWIVTRMRPNAIRETREFWTGSGWSEEYPDAMQMAYREAIAQANKFGPAEFTLFKSSEYEAGTQGKGKRVGGRYA